ncbi:hypothetical protein GCM10011507_13480 [Edaphobacter acidisoli]|uniref:Uncharacterized protein n=1 Tax=Edaphobacter acidisoli TaxID=2040573 RepID=A0A916W3I4_9BACT|nr:hypothetical protein GCM10011507_13480 [Edaphobacter acidisoli]
MQRVYPSRVPGAPGLAFETWVHSRNLQGLPNFSFRWKGTASAVPKSKPREAPSTLPKAGVKPEGRNDQNPPTNPPQNYATSVADNLTPSA